MVRARARFQHRTTDAAWYGGPNGRTISRQNVSQPFDGFSVAIPVIDPGADGVAGTTDDGADLPAFELGRRLWACSLSMSFATLRTRTAAIGRGKPRRPSGSRDDGLFVAGFAHTWYGDQASGYLGQSVRNNLYPLTPNDLINTGPNGQHRFRMWSAKIHGTYAAPLGCANYTLSAASVRSALRANICPLAECGHRSDSRGADRHATDGQHHDRRRTSRERLSRGHDRRVAGFFDLFNLFNTNAEQNLNWSSGSSFLRPLSIISPRIARIGAKVEW